MCRCNIIAELYVQLPTANDNYKAVVTKTIIAIYALIPNFIQGAHLLIETGLISKSFMSKMWQ
jgi:hypothetical protein